MSEIRKHPLSAKGKYYVVQNSCGCMGTCELAAPNNFVLNETDYGAYVFKQPETLEQEGECQEAMMCCAFEAVHDDGEENEIL